VDLNVGGEGGVADGQREALERARAAAIAGSFPAFFQALYDSHILDGLVRRLEASMDRHDADFAVGEAVDALWAELSKAAAVADVAAFLVKATQRRAAEIRRTHRRERGLTPHDLDAVEAMEARRDPDRFKSHDFDDQRASYESPARNDLRREAVQAARRLIPRLGQQNVQLVMSYLVDAVEQEREDLPAQEVAEALGLTVGTAKVSMTRGLQRLNRIARQEGLAAHLLRDLGVELEDEEDGDGMER
jgi:DNA-directed RNA polymerase specialized sigma24 family protein